MNKFKTSLLTTIIFICTAVAVALIVSFVFCAPVSVDVPAAGKPGALASASAPEGTPYTGNGGALAAGTYYLADDAEITSGITVGGTVTLDLNGHELKYTGTGNSSVITVNSGTFTLRDSSRKGKITGGSGKAIDVGGGVITYSGGGVYVDGGTFDMTGGEISNNTVNSGNADCGGGVYVNDGIFNMSGGKISGNEVSGSGGGVYVGGGTFNMTGGYIRNNTAKSGGGVYVGNGTFEMTDGLIMENTVSNNGGGVYVSGTFNVSGTPFIMNNNKNINSENNVYRALSKKIIVTGELEADGRRAQIGVNSTGAIAEGFTTDNNPTGSKPNKFFFSDDDAAICVYATDDGTVNIAAHSYTGEQCTNCGRVKALYWGITEGEYSDGTAKVVLTLGSSSTSSTGATLTPYSSSINWTNRKDITEVTVDGSAYAPNNMSYWFMNCEYLTKADLSKLDTSEVKGMSQLFDNCKRLAMLDVSSFITARVTGMAGMFRYCRALTTLDLSGFNTSRVSDMTMMFFCDEELTTLDLSGFVTSNVTTMKSMFYNCLKLEEADVSRFDTSSVKDFTYMFRACNALEEIDLSNFDVSSATDISGMFLDCSGLTSLDLSGFDTANVKTMNSLFSGCKKIESLDFTEFPDFTTENVTSMAGIFSYCEQLTTLDISTFDTSKVTDMGGMFRRCRGLTTLDFTTLPKFDTTKVTSMEGMFYECSGLETLNVSTFDTSAVTNMCANYMGMFFGCEKLTTLDLSNFDTSGVGTMQYMFYGCKLLQSLDLSSFDTSEVKSMFSMFSVCRSLTSLDFSECANFTAEKVTDMSYMFSSCSGLTSLGLASFNTKVVTDMNYMFSGCSGLTSLDLSSFDTSEVKYMSNMFSGCSELKSLDLSGFNTEKVTDMNNMFSECGKLKTIEISSSLATTLDSKYSAAKIYSSGHEAWYGDDGKKYTATQRFDRGGTYVASPFAVTVGTDTTYYDTLTAAWEKACSVAVATVKMLDDATITSGLEVATGNKITLDLNGNVLEYKGSGDSVITVNAVGEFTLTDGNTDTTKKHTVTDPNDSNESIEITGGLITGGHCYNGGGVYVNGGMFNMSCGSISGNTAERSSSSGGNGGGVYVGGGMFNMSGGSIIGNAAVCNSSSGGNGGGVYVSSGTFDMTGGSISGNMAENNSGNGASGGGIYVNNGGTFNVSGAPNITGNTRSHSGNEGVENVRLWSGNKIAVTGVLNDGSEIGVGNTGAVVTGFTATNNPSGAAPSAYFIPDDSSNNCITVDGEGVVTIAKHVEVTDAAVPPTCEETGLTEGKHCSTCNEVLVAQDTLSSLGHSASDEWTTGENTHWHACTRTDCDAVLDEEAHTCAQAKKENVVEATCSSTGSYDEVVYCSVCNKLMSKESCTTEVDPDNHVLGTWCDPVDANCTVSGTKGHKDCTLCGKPFDADNVEITDLVIPTNDKHAWDGGTVTTPPTCTQAGVKTYTCDRDSEHTKTESVGATGHSFGEWTVVKKATVDEEGEERRVCANDDTHYESRVIPKLTPPQEEQPPQEQTPSQEEEQTPSQEGEQAPQKDWTWLIILIVLILIAAGVTAYLVYRKRHKKPTAEKSDGQNDE